MIPMLAILILPATVIAMPQTNNDSNSKVKYDISNLTYERLMEDCGSSKDVISSSIFGSPSDYEKLFPRMGKFAAEIESMSRISLNSSTKIKSIMSTAKERKNEILKTMNGINRIANKNKGYIAVSQEIIDDTMKKYKSDFNELQKESNFISSNAIKSSKDILKQNIHENDDNYSPYSDYDVRNVCISWWEKGMPHIYRGFVKEDKLGQILNQKQRYISSDKQKDVLIRQIKITKDDVNIVTTLNKSSAKRTLYRFDVQRDKTDNWWKNGELVEYNKTQESEKKDNKVKQRIVANQIDTSNWKSLNSLNKQIEVKKEETNWWQNGEILSN